MASHKAPVETPDDKCPNLRRYAKACLRAAGEDSVEALEKLQGLSLTEVGEVVFDYYGGRAEHAEYAEHAEHQTPTPTHENVYTTTREPPDRLVLRRIADDVLADEKVAFIFAHKGPDGDERVTKVIYDSGTYGRRDARNAMRTELAIARYASDHDFGVRVFETSTCHASTANRSRPPHVLVQQRGTPVEHKAWSVEEMLKLFKVVDRMHDKGIFHGDLYVKNIVRVRDGANGVNGAKDEPVYRMIDFGHALPFGRPLPQILRAMDYVTLLYGWYYEHEFHDGREPIGRWHFVPRISDRLGRWRLTRELVRKFGPEDVLNSIRARVCTKGTLRNPWRNDVPDAPKTNMVYMYAQVFRLLPRDVVLSMQWTLALYVGWAGVSTERSRSPAIVAELVAARIMMELQR